MFFDNKKKEECCGCTACMNACPTSAIKMEEDAEGFLYPVIDKDTCVHCNLCRKVCCWANASYENSSEPVALASILKNKSERQKSTSGGVFYAIATWVINQGGLVYGAAFDDNLQLRHISAKTIDDLQKLRGSKYIQSELGSIFKEIKKQLESDSWAYFVGTGCQVAGLKAFLRKDYPKLITSDLVCHGVPSQKIFNNHIAYMEEKYHDKVVSYQFRDYIKGGGCEICGFANRKHVINRSYDISPYLYGFMYGYINRYSCYDCRFAKVPRQGDITLADYWGVNRFFPDMDNSCGCSLLLLNTEKGKAMWKRVKRSCDYYVSNVADAAKYNGNLVQTSEKPEGRDAIFEQIKKRGYGDVAAKELRSPNFIKISFANHLFYDKVFRPLSFIYHIWRKLTK